MSEHFNVARLKRGNAVFEVVINPDEALAFKKGKTDLRSALRTDQIYTDASRMLLATQQELNATFKSIDSESIAKQIILEGEIQLTTEQRNEIREQKIRQVMEMVHRFGIDPKTKLPHPITRIENAFQEAKVHVDEHKSAEEQLPEIIRALAAILPVKISTKRVQITIPAQFASKCYGTIKRYATIKSESWESDGSWKGEVELPGGLEQDMYDALNKIAHGQIASRLLES